MDDTNQENSMPDMNNLGLTGPDKMYMQEQQAQAMQAAEDNPFQTAQQQQNVQVPDEPVNYGGGMADILLSDSEVPQILREKYWYVFNKDNVLTFLDEDRKNDKLMAFDISVIDGLNTMQSYDDYTFETEMQHNIIRNAFDVKLDRAVGMKSSNMKNERVILQSQFSEAKQIREDEPQNQVKEGFFKRLLGRR